LVIVSELMQQIQRLPNQKRGMQILRTDEILWADQLNDQLAFGLLFQYVLQVSCKWASRSEIEQGKISLLTTLPEV